MAATYLSVARLLQLGVAVAWQEAVAVVSAADARSDADGIPITLEDCHVTTAGDVHLSPPTGGSGYLSSLQLLEALLAGQASPEDLRALVAAADCGLAGLPAGGGARWRVDLRWCLGTNPRAHIAQLAARALSADTPAGSESSRDWAETDSRHHPLIRNGPRGPVEPVRTRRRHAAVTLRVRRLPPAAALGMAALLLIVAIGAAAMGVLASGIAWPGGNSADVGGSEAEESLQPPDGPGRRTGGRPEESSIQLAIDEPGRARTNASR